MSAVRIAVLGGGIIGCLVARELTTALPAARVTLVERDLVGLGASQRSAGVHFPLGRSARTRAMAVRSQAYYDGLLAAAPALPIYPLALDAAAPVAAAVGLRDRFVDPGPLRTMTAAAGRRVPWPGGGSTWRLRGCQAADVGDLTRSLALDARRGGVEVLEGVRVAGVDEDTAGVTVRLGSGGSLRADRVLLAPGPWACTPEWTPYTEPLHIRIKRVVALHIDHPVDADSRGVMFPLEDAFLVPLPHRGHWLFSYTCTEWDVHPDEQHDGVGAEHLDQARALLAAHAPDLAELARSGRVFCDAYSPSREPLVTPVGDTGRVTFAGAANGSGYRLGPAIAAEAIALLRTPHLEQERRHAHHEG